MQSDRDTQKLRLLPPGPVAVSLAVATQATPAKASIRLRLRLRLPPTLHACAADVSHGETKYLTIYDTGTDKATQPNEYICGASRSTYVLARLIEINNDMSDIDIENPPPPSTCAGDAAADGVDAAAPAEPSRHGLWAWKERLAIACYTAGNSPQLGEEEVATVDAEQRSRYSFVFLWFAVSLALAVGFFLLMLLNPLHLGPAGIVATRVVGIVGFVVAFCSAGFFVELADKMAEGTTNVHWVVDYMM